MASLAWPYATSSSTASRPPSATTRLPTVLVNCEDTLLGQLSSPQGGSLYVLAASRDRRKVLAT